ncbi:arabinofuranosidase [Nocardia transvalensis]|uniref:arabinofuranosidase n=1 Tax=Nocardia transvalensis TaxID=37333 RepID=UPI001894430E|nr:arabinofuranosidase [Nocardia transvalensis]
MMLVVLSMVVGAMVAPASAEAAGPSTRYTMVAFTNLSETDVDVYESGDATRFHPVGLAAYRPPFGLVRDPDLMRHRDGFYYIVYTTGWDGNTIGLARSPDRVHWTFMLNYPVPLCCVGLPGTGSASGPASQSAALDPLTRAIATGSAAVGLGASGSALSPFVTHAWAPAWFVDGDQVNIIVSLSSGYDFVPYIMTALDPALTLWSMPTPLAGIGPNHIDTTIVRDGGLYHAFTKNETTKFIEHAMAPTAAGPYQFVGTDDWAGWGSLREGPSLVRLDDGRWRIFMDSYVDHRYFYSDSVAGLDAWGPLQELPDLSGNVRHFSILAEPD